MVRPLFAIAALATLAHGIVSSETGPPRAPARPQENLLLSIGVETGDSLLEFARITSALRLSNGDIVVANGASSQLRWFNSSGKFIRAIGRRGQGPNEFGRSIFIYDAPNDTIVVHDAGNRRLHYVSPQGTFAREDSLRNQQRIIRIYDRILIERIPPGIGADRISSIAVAIPIGSNDLALRAIPDRSGNLWLRTKPDGGAWTVYGTGGRAISTVSLPASFEPYQIGDTLILGRDRDALGVERVQLRRFMRQPARPTASQPQPRPLYDAAAERSANAAAITGMQVDLRNLVTAQELFFVQNRRYTGSIDALAFKPSSAATIRIARVTATGYWLIASLPQLRTTCMFATGDDWPLGAVDACG